MNMPLLKAEPATAMPPMPAKVLPLDPPPFPPPRAGERNGGGTLARRIGGRLSNLPTRVIPPTVVIVPALLILALSCRQARPTLPPPSPRLNETSDPICAPVFHRFDLAKG